jgi:hypothetical protein
MDSDLEKFRQAFIIGARDYVLKVGRMSPEWREFWNQTLLEDPVPQDVIAAYIQKVRNADPMIDRIMTGDSGIDFPILANGMGVFRAALYDALGIREYEVDDEWNVELQFLESVDLSALTRPQKAARQRLKSYLAGEARSLPNRPPPPIPYRSPTSDPTSESVDDPTSDPIDDPTSDPIDDPTSDPIDDPTSEPINDPTGPPIDPEQTLFGQSFGQWSSWMSGWGGWGGQTGETKTTFTSELDEGDKARMNSLRPFLPVAGTDVFEEQESMESDKLKEQNLLMGMVKPPNWPLGHVDNPLWLGNKVNEGMRYSDPLFQMPTMYKGGTLIEGATLYGSYRPTPMDIEEIRPRPRFGNSRKRLR